MSAVLSMNLAFNFLERADPWSDRILVRPVWRGAAVQRFFRRSRNDDDRFSPVV